MEKNSAKRVRAVMKTGQTTAVLPLISEGNRYFVPLKRYAKLSGKSLQTAGDTVYLPMKDRPPVYFDNRDDSMKICEREPCVSLIDFCRVMKQKTRWNIEEKQITLRTDDPPLPEKVSPGRDALIRLEDITAGRTYLDSDNLEKLRCVADFLYASGVPFHIAWIPRFIDPPNGIDNDISVHDNMRNAEFLFTLEYMISKNGLLGLHGYTHQYKDEMSGVGTEFSALRFVTEQSVRERVQAAITAAVRLKLPFDFFETPHYAATAFQQSIFEEYFNILYEPYVGLWNRTVIVSPRNGKTLYIPTPLGYMEGENGCDALLSRIENVGDDTLASLFFHPFLEFEFMKIEKDSVLYPEDSPLHRIVAALKAKGCRCRKITGAWPQAESS